MEVINDVLEKCTPDSFYEEGYQLANPDVRRAVESGQFPSGKNHFDLFGHKEERLVYNLAKLEEVKTLREQKLKKLDDKLDFSLPYEKDPRTNQINFLTPELKQQFDISDTDNVSSHGYDPEVLDLLNEFADGLILDCGAGLRKSYYSNVINLEIAPYYSTDILSVGEKLPFKDESFDAVISVAVLEHVKDPFLCAREISRVLKKGGKLFSCIPFLQPYHGFPHHYYNMTHQGHSNLYRPFLNIREVKILESTRPVFSLSWFLESYSRGLPEEERHIFLNKRVEDLIGNPINLLQEGFVRALDEEKNLELASATVLIAEK